MGLTIVLGYDGSDCARAALARSADLLRQTGGGKMVVVVAYPLSAAYVPTAGVAGAPMLMGSELQDHIDMLQETARQQAEEAREELRGMGIAAETEVTAEPAAEALLDAAGRHSADLIAVGTHGEGAISGVLLGSTSYRLVHRSRLPLLIVPLCD